MAVTREVVTQEHFISFANTVSSLARIGLLMAENDTSGIISDVQKEADLGTLFELTSSMMAVVIDGANDLDNHATAGPVIAEQAARHEAADLLTLGPLEVAGFAAPVRAACAQCIDETPAPAVSMSGRPIATTSTASLPGA